MYSILEIIKSWLILIIIKEKLMCIIMIIPKVNSENNKNIEYVFF